MTPPLLGELQLSNLLPSPGDLGRLPAGVVFSWDWARSWSSGCHSSLIRKHSCTETLFPPYRVIISVLCLNPEEREHGCGTLTTRAWPEVPDFGRLPRAVYFDHCIHPRVWAPDYIFIILKYFKIFSWKHLAMLSCSMCFQFSGSQICLACRLSLF